MKFALLVLSISFSVSLFAGDLECRVVRAEENNPFEDGLGPYGDPEVDDDSETVTLPVSGKIESLSIGQKTWRTKQGDKITRSQSAKGTVYRVGGYTVITYPSERGVLLQRENGESSVFGTIDCSSLEKVKAASIGSPGTKPLSAAQRKDLPKTVTTNIDKVDLPLELGDGYYDLRATRLYVVREGREVVGYLLWAKLYYTEDNEEVEALARFDRNGLWLGEVER